MTSHTPWAPRHTLSLFHERDREISQWGQSIQHVEDIRKRLLISLKTLPPRRPRRVRVWREYWTKMRWREAVYLGLCSKGPSSYGRSSPTMKYPPGSEKTGRKCCWQDFTRYKSRDPFCRIFPEIFVC